MPSVPEIFIFANVGLGAGAPAIGIPFFWPSAVMPNTVMDEWSDMVFLKFNNSTFSATTYPKLALVYPGLTLTEHRGEFIRIWDDGRGVDSGRPLLSAQDASAINLLLGENSNQPGLGQIAVSNDDGQNVSSGWSVAKNPGQIHNSDGVNFAKVRPRNIAWNFLVRAK
ncbi:TPA: phage tail protein [Citrobacter braakii]|nr:phage tail protein [Citrobacter braakii]